MIFTVAAALCAIATPVVAAAETDEGSFVGRVEIADLDLTTEAGVAKLDQRIRTVIRRECASGGRGLNARRIEQACSAEAYASAKPQIRFVIAKANAERPQVASRPAASTAQTPGA
jgi:UrcA family protein